MLRTAAGTAVALDQLARADARRLLVCGTGAQALPHIEAVAAIRDLESVQLWGRSPERAQATLAQLRERFPNLQTDIAPDVSAAARRADLIVCLTAASKPRVHTGDVRPGTTIAAVGSDTPESRSSPPNSSRRRRSCAASPTSAPTPEALRVIRRDRRLPHAGRASRGAAPSRQEPPAARRFESGSRLVRHSIRHWRTGVRSE
jgi:hypothetical protein